MDLYQFCLYLGFIGIAAMAFLGMSHGGHANHGHDSGGFEAGGHGGAHGVSHHGGSHFGDSHGGAHHSAHDAVTSHNHAAQHGHSAPQDNAHATPQNAHRAESLLAFLSPRVWFSVLLGFGAAGTLGQKAVAEPWLFVLAALCGLAFEFLIFRPLWNLVFRFASNPARTLESAVAEEALAVTTFDQSGHGLISIDLDGQVLQILARLSTRSRESGVRVRVGDRLFVEEVDTQKNACVVSPVGFGNAPKNS